MPSIVVRNDKRLAPLPGDYASSSDPDDAFYVYFNLANEKSTRRFMEFFHILLVFLPRD